MSKRLLSRPLGRCVGLDVHLDFIEIAICEEGKVFSAGRVPSTPEGIKTLADSLAATDRIALEVTGSSWEIVRLLEEGDLRGSEKKWARNTADILVEIHSLFGVVNPDRSKRGDFDIDDSTAWLILPMIQLVYTLTEGDEITGSIEQHADTLVQTEKTMIFAILKLSFILSGDRIEPGIEDEIYDILDSTKGARRQTKLVSRKLRSIAAEAGEKEEQVGALNRDIGKRISTAAMVFEALAEYCFQWNKVDYVALEIRTLGDSKVIGLEINVKPGKKLVLKAPHFASPRLIFTGKNRIVVQPDPEHEGRIDVLFTSEEGGAAEIQLPKTVSLPSRIFFLPFDNARLKEVRVVSTVEPPNVKKRVIAAYMDAVGKEDGRRMLIVETSKEPVIELVDEVREIYKGDLKKYAVQYYNDRKVYEFKKKKRKAAGLRLFK